jgi:hypothetical protein
MEIQTHQKTIQESTQNTRQSKQAKQYLHKRLTLNNTLFIMQLVYKINCINIQKEG